MNLVSLAILANSLAFAVGGPSIPGPTPRGPRVEVIDAMSMHYAIKTVIGSSVHSKRPLIVRQVGNVAAHFLLRAGNLYIANTRSGVVLVPVNRRVKENGIFIPYKNDHVFMVEGVNDIDMALLTQRLTDRLSALLDKGDARAARAVLDQSFDNIRQRIRREIVKDIL